MRYSVLILVVALLAGCSSGKTPRYTSASLPPMQSPTSAQLIVYYPSYTLLPDNYAEIKINNQKSCTIESGNLVALNMPAGKQTVFSATVCGKLGTSSFTFETKPGERYYLRMGPSAQTTAALVTDIGVADGTSSGPDKGPYKLDLMKEPDAMEEIQGLKTIYQCH